ncbi:TPA: hypothetical protein O8U20_004194 [Enterobacter cloacae]|nr:hypothetical protein [Enterobacter cloacae]HDC4602710.1 hypothetical protein [Enterobacter cloacae]
MDQPFTVVNRNPSQLLFKLWCAALSRLIKQGVCQDGFALFFSGLAIAVGWVSLFWGASLGGVHCGGAFWGIAKNSGMVSGLYFIRRVPDQGKKRTFCLNAGIVISLKKQRDEINNDTPGKAEIARMFPPWRKAE